MNPLLMLIMMSRADSHADSRGDPRMGTIIIATIGAILLAALVATLFAIWGTNGVMIGVPTTISISALLGYLAQRCRMRPADLGLTVMTVVTIIVMASVLAIILIPV
jgi:hypothetical protein